MKTAKKIRGILIWLLVTVLSLLVIYDIVGNPALTPEMAMRRSEKYHMVGPSKVIWEGVSCDWWYDRLLLGETDYGYCLYQYDSESFGYAQNCLRYVEKGTRACFLGRDGGFNWDINVLPIFAITENPRAVRARLTLETVSDDHSIYEGIYTVEAELCGGVLYQFALDMTDMDQTVRNFWEDRLCDDMWGYYGIFGKTTLELYDREGNLLETIVTEYPANEK